MADHSVSEEPGVASCGRTRQVADVADVEAFRAQDEAASAGLAALYAAALERAKRDEEREERKEREEEGVPRGISGAECVLDGVHQENVEPSKVELLVVFIGVISAKSDAFFQAFCVCFQTRLGIG